ncbi:hypothetical protein B484DRAFT_393142 [Ochromonadaceae sp. CCMP2298]|nr:hypothetical protein B484DRAFT_393142 [Ochromonadaceae sp. CCMP2298]
MVTTSAISTVSYYMLEFQDSINQKWMVNFKNFKESGFADDDWHDYLETLITLTTQSVKVYIKPGRMAARGKEPNDPNMVGMYKETVEPRKIAHRIVAVRENIMEELVQDLGTVRLENQEAIHFANAWINSNREVAEKSRGLTRFNTNNQGGSTPLRDNTYSDVSLLLTNFALDLVKADLLAKDDTEALLLIDELLGKVAQEVDKLDALDRKLALSRLPISLLEELCYRGLSEGATKVTGKGSSILKLAQDLLQTRLSLAMGSIKVLESLNRENRNYYQMIKDHGGFQTFDLNKKRPEVIVVNLLDEARNEAAEKMAERGRQAKEKAKERTRALVQRETEREALALVQAAASWARMQYAKVEEEAMEQNLFGMGTIGPIMM